MKMKHKIFILAAALLMLALFAGGCAAEPSPYEKNDANGATISVRYDANGGFFTTNTSVIVDAYDPSALPQSGGNYIIALLQPDDDARGNDAFLPINNGYFLAGWYAQRNEITDADGNVSYTYGKKWDFAKDRLEVSVDGSYSSGEPVLTLYAAWVPLFKIEFCQMGTGELLNTITFDPTMGAEFQVPDWNAETGTMEMHKFPTVNGCTFQSASLDPEGLQRVTGTVVHTGSVDAATGTGMNTTMKLYVDYTQGEWYRIYTAEQFLENASVTGSYEICADLDFDGKIWPTALMHGNYSGTIRGNGHVIKNVSLVQTNNSKTNAGLFGVLTDTAVISDLLLQNVSFTIKAGTRVAGTSYGLLAGSVSSGAELTGVTIADSVIYIDSGCYFGTDEYAIGLVCGTGETNIDYSGISAAAAGDAPEKVSIAVEGQSVSVSIAME